MKLQKGKWYVCTKAWSDDGWTKFWEGSILLCGKDGELKDCYGITHVFPEKIAGALFREATTKERNIVSATEVNMDEFMEDIDFFDSGLSIKDIYRKGAEAMLQHIRANLSIKG